MKKAYSQDMLLEAMRLVKNKELSLNKASKLFGIPYATLGDKIRGRRPVQAKPKFLLMPEEEEELVKWIILLGKRGFGRSRDEIKDAVKQILDRRRAQTKCIDNRPGRAWMDYFFKRHPELSCRTPQALGQERAMVTCKSLSEWFSMMENYLNTEDPSLLTSPERLYNADETGFCLSTKGKRVVAEKGSKHVYAVTGNTKRQVTVLACSSAAGHYIPPLIIYPYKRMPQDNLLNGFEEAHFQISPNGWITGPLFFAWLRDIFVPAVADKKKPVVLFVDGHSSHSSLIEVIDLCNTNNIILYCLESHLIQPLDQAFFGAIKTAWEKASREYLSSNGENVNLRSFAQVLAQAWNATATPLISLKGFNASGIFPFNPQQILNSEKLASSHTFTTVTSHTHTPTTTTDTEHSQPLFNPQLLSTSSSPNPSQTHISCDQPQSVYPSTSVSNTSQSQANISLSIDDVKSLCNFVLKIGQDNTDNFFHMYQQNVNTQNQDFFSFKSMVNTILQVPSSSPLYAAPDVPTVDQSLSTTGTSNISEILAMPTFPTSKTFIEKKKTMAPMALSWLEHKQYLRKKEEEKEAAARKKELNKEMREKKKKAEEAEMLKRKREELQEVRKKKKEEEEAAKRRKRDWGALKKLEREMQRKNVNESETSESENDMVMDDSSEVDEELVYGKSIACAGCNTTENTGLLVQCEICDGWWHSVCTQNASVVEKDEEELKNIQFVCVHCVPRT